MTAGERPQVVVPAGAWQAAEPLAAWALVGCIVAPAFDFAGFELAPPDWSPDAPEIDVRESWAGRGAGHWRRPPDADG